MKRLYLLLSLALTALTASAQLNGDGYYRVQNYGSQRWAYLCDNTGKIDYGTQDADVGAIQLWKDIARTYDDPSSVMYIEMAAEGRYDIQAQGTGLFQIIGHYVEVAKKDNNQYWVYASQNGVTKYLSDNRTNDNDRGMPNFNGPTNYRLWSVFPINETDNYVGITPTINVGGKHYAAFYASFPFRKVSSGLKVYYIKKVDANKGAAVMEEITSTIIPAATPVVVECPSTTASGNKILPVVSSASNPSDNQLGGVYFCNAGRNVGTPFKKATMRTLGVRADGKIGFISTPNNLTSVTISSKDYDCLPANSSYLNVPSGTPAELLMVTQEEYDAIVTVDATSITLDKTEAALSIGDELQLKATVKPDNATNKNVTWKSSNTAVATVTNGKVVAVAVGTATITATTADGTQLSATCKITVSPQLVTSIALDKTTATLKVGEEVQLTATVKPDNAANKKVTWKSSNEKVATVTDGKVIAVGAGSATIIATTADGSNLSATCAVTVNSSVATAIALSQTTATLKVGEALQLKATIQPESASQQLTWKSSNEKVATVADGKVVAVAEGSATITATTTDGSDLSATCVVTVNPVLATDITLDKTEATLKVGETLQLKATVLPDNVTNKQVTWKSSNDAIATVSDGKVVAIADGKVAITATTTDGTELSATCAVTVSPILASSISLSQTSAKLEIGEEIQLTATVLPENAKNKKVTWTSSNEEVATVEDGKVVALSEGTTTIMATTVDGTNLNATCSVRVIPVLAKSITLDKTTATLKVGEDVQLTATVLPENASNKKVTWQSGNTAVATVADGKVVAVGVGEVTITATTADDSNLSATCLVKVEPILADTIFLSQTSQRLVVNSMFQLTATVLPENATNTKVDWSSSDTLVVKVDEYGRVKAFAEGEAVVKATTTDGSNLSATCEIMVRPLNVLADSIVVSSKKEELLLGGEVQLTATVYPEDVSTTAAVWRSSDRNVVTVSGNGLVRAVGLGEAIITVTTVDGSELSDTCVVTVKPVLVDTLEISQTSAEMLVGETLRLTARVTPANATDKTVEWSSSNEEIATVENGKVTAVAVGEVVIKVATVDGSELKDSCVVKVKPILAESISISQTAAELTIGEELQLTATVLPKNATNKDVTWKSSNDSIATVVDGKVKAVGVGEAVITVTTADSTKLSATCTIKVIAQLATSLTLSDKKLELALGDEYELKATVLPDNTSNKKIEWSTSNEKVATVEDGKVKTVGLGVAIITAKTTDGSKLSATCSIIVNPVLAEALELDPAEKEIFVGDTLRITPKFTPENVTNKELFWISYNERVAKVKDGLIQAIAPGEARIVAMTMDGTGLMAESIINVKNPNGILAVEAEQEGVAFYTLDGRQRATLRRGVNIVRLADGSVRKVVVK